MSPNELVPTLALGRCVRARRGPPLPAPAALLDARGGGDGARGGRLRVELCFLAVLALASTMTVPVVGTLLIFSLMIGPPAAARSLAASPARAMALSVALALVTVWAAIAASYTQRLPGRASSSARSAPAAYAIGRVWACAAGARGTCMPRRSGARGRRHYDRHMAEPAARARRYAARADGLVGRSHGGLAVGRRLQARRAPGGRCWSCSPQSLAR